MVASVRPRDLCHMDSLFVSAGVVAVAEIGDKTQLLTLALAARYRRVAPILLGILLATLANHGLAAWLGAAVAGWIGPDLLRWIVGGSFLAMAAWCLVPDAADEGAAESRPGWGPFLATLVSFFLVEIGDKTQIATIALAARFHDVILVTCGTTLGILLVNLPAVLLGDVAAQKLPMRLIRAAAAASFAVLGGLTLWQGAALMPG